MFTKTIHLQSTKKDEVILITSMIQSMIDESHVSSGAITLFVPHTTAAITINECSDPDVRDDFLLGLNNIVPDNPAFKHIEGNASAHIKSSIIGVEQTLLIEKRKLVLGTWQGIYFCEFDGPRHRSLIVKIKSD